MRLMFYKSLRNDVERMQKSWIKLQFLRPSVLALKKQLSLLRVNLRNADVRKDSKVMVSTHVKEKIKKLLEQVETLGEAGKVDEAEALMRKIFAVVTIGFVKDAKDHIDVQGFNVYHKNRLIKLDVQEALIEEMENLLDVVKTLVVEKELRVMRPLLELPVWGLRETSLLL
ncbi:hypothetical protein QJS10_CPA10g01504 [Acorus calamus]|uniref:Morc S5 domain-containing protein n=1 Tax=Acorus calamus TaxID=4465 RepID=A0AAV9E3D1_ACOCL|nr:hypothetical protein QJS10_CPA10g01504 [Acorus calamus]